MFLDAFSRASHVTPPIRLNRSKTALVTVDVQNVFCHVARWSMGWVFPDQADINRSVKNLATILADRRRLNLPVFHVRSYLKPQSEYDFYRIRPEAQDTLIDKSEQSAFEDDEFGRRTHNGLLERALRQKDIDTLVIAGFWQELCVARTVESALHRKFNVVVLEDCTRPYDYAHQSSSKAAMQKNGAHMMAAANFLCAFDE
ncbi:MAG: cysteine hydrolase [Alphaproteobacteria bacterium]